MAFPFVPAAFLLSGLLKGLFSSKSQGKQEDEQYRAAQERWNADEALRAARLDALSGIMGNVQGSLGKGAPNYLIDPAALERIKAARPFGVGDPSEGRGSGLLSGLFGGVQNALLLKMLGVGANTGADTTGTGASSSQGAGFLAGLGIPERRDVPDLSGGGSGLPPEVCRMYPSLCPGSAPQGF